MLCLAALATAISFQPYCEPVLDSCSSAGLEHLFSGILAPKKAHLARSCSTAKPQCLQRARALKWGFVLGRGLLKPSSKGFLFLQQHLCTVGPPRALMRWDFKKGETLLCIRSYSSCNRLLQGGSATTIGVSVQSP